MKKIDSIKFKSHKVLIFESVTGRKLEDYLIEKNNLDWTLQKIADEMNKSVWKKYPEKVIEFTEDNISKYFRRIGLKTSAPRGRKARQ